MQQIERFETFAAIFPKLKVLVIRKSAFLIEIKKEPNWMAMKRKNISIIVAT